MRCSPLCWTLTFPVLRSPATYGRIGCCGTQRSAITAGGSLRIITRRSRSPCSGAQAIEELLQRGWNIGQAVLIAVHPSPD